MHAKEPGATLQPHCSRLIVLVAMLLSAAGVNDPYTQTRPCRSRPCRIAALQGHTSRRA